MFHIHLADSEYLDWQGCHFPDNMKFRDHLGVWGRSPPEKFPDNMRVFNLAENEFQTTKSPDFSLTFGILSQIP